MNSKKLDHKILARYLSGDCSEKEVLHIKQWTQEDTMNKQQLKEYEYYWEKAALGGKRNIENFNIEQDWAVLKQKIKKRQNFKASHSKKDTPFFTFKRENRLYQFLRFAAIFIVAACLGILAYQQWNKTEPNKPVLQKIATAMGQRVHLTLSDGTRVLLNADSQLRLPDVFNAGQREVFLQGQAFFHVASNPDKPFIIHLNSSVIKVLGTEFSVRAYPEDDEIRVVVKEGKVAFKMNNSLSSDSTILTNHEFVLYNLKTNKFERRTIEDLNFYLGWKKGYLNFKETLMSEVAIDLERRYDIEVVFSDAEIKKMKLTAYFKTWSIRNVVDIISTSLKIEYRLKNDQIIFYKQ